MTEDTKNSTKEGEAMDIWQHLNELRQRIFKALVALVIGTAISFTFANTFIEFLSRPIGGLENLVAIEITENIGVFMRVALLSGFIIALPFILYELLAFIFPGLTSGERRWVYTAIPVMTILFVVGVAFAYFVMLPAAVPFLVSFLAGVPTTPRLSNYINFVTNLMFWIGLSFETPIVVFVLAKFNLVSPRTLLKQWRVAVVVIAVISAMITPTVDPVNMLLLMAPLFLIYLLSVAFASLARRGQ